MKQSNYQSQGGMALIVSLIILMVLTILGVTSMMSSRTEVSMAGNLRRAGTAFNAAEAGLRAGEKYVNDSTSTNIYADTSILGLYDQAEPSPSYGTAATWADSQVATTSLPVPDYVAEQPRFIIHFLGDRSQNVVAAVNVGGYGSGQPGLTVSNFKITARGIGLTTNEVRYVQSHMGHEY
jgi:type IV pilus assembly protein PilX